MLNNQSIIRAIREIETFEKTIDDIYYKIDTNNKKEKSSQHHDKIKNSIETILWNLYELKDENNPYKNL